MIVFAMALLTQSAELPASAVEAARACAAIEARSMGDARTLAGYSRASQLTLLAARETRGGKRMLDNDSEIALVAPRIAGQRDDLALRSECKRRFPQVWATTATLPADSFERAILCAVTAGSMMGLARALRDGTETQRWESIGVRLARLPVLSNAELQKRGISSFDIMKDEMDGRLRLAIGTSALLPLAQACEAAYPA